MTTMTTFSAATVSSTTIVGTDRKSFQETTKVKYINGLNSFGGLKANNHVASLGLPMSTERSFAKIVSSLRTQSSQAKGGGDLSSACNAPLEISGLLLSFLAWFLLKLLDLSSSDLKLL
ncbi:hypothetical protein P3S68_020812 [Capsicum galapagoense]